jgi:phospho-2-dehydro-3-deoxyheptonate aldolase
MHDLPLNETGAAFIESSRKQAEAILNRKDDRLLVVAGPCSIHDHKSALEYAQLIQAAREKHVKDLEIVMRVYFENHAPPLAGRASSMTRTSMKATTSMLGCVKHVHC